MLFSFGRKPAPTGGVPISRPRAVVVRGLTTDDPEHDYFQAYRYLTEADALANVRATVIDEEIRSRRMRDDDDLIAGIEYWYCFSSFDIWSNESLLSAPLPVRYRGLSDDDIDQTSPRAPGTPTLANAPGDYDEDGKVEAGLMLGFTAPASGRAPKKYFVEVWRSTVVGDAGSLAGYSFWRDMTIRRLTKRFAANSRFFHKAQVTPISSNDVEGAQSAFTSVGVKPSSSIPAPAVTTLAVRYRKDRAILKWDECDDPRYAFTRIFTSFTNNSDTATLGGTIKGNRFPLDDFDSGDTIYIWTRNVLVGGRLSPRYPADQYGGFEVTIPS
jgi:hypothetical protein